LSIDRSVRRWIGTALALVAVAATISLAAAGRLSLYIHPRYTVFTVLLVSLAGLLAIAAIVAGSPGHPSHEGGRPPTPPDELAPPGWGDDPPHPPVRSRRWRSGNSLALRKPGHDHPDHDETQAPPPSLWSRLNGWLMVVVLVGATVGMLVLPPSTLSATARQNRTLVTSGHALDATNTTALVGGNSATFTVKDWAALLREGGAGAVLGRKADLTGYVLAQGDDNTFFVTRLLVSCCAVDSQPVGVPVYLPNWRDQFAAGGWIAVKGTFVDESEQEVRFPTAIKISTIKKIDEPSQPYVF
jgi:uncharacterized repeat protein (TIGR03943 family)